MPIGERAFVWTPSTGTLDLKSVLQTLNVDTTGWTLNRANAISYDGSAITGDGEFNGVSRPWVIRGFPPLVCGLADIGMQGGVPGYDGVLDNNDFIIFIANFFSHLPSADRGSQGGVPGQDGQFDNNDFIVYIDQFFSGC